MSWGKNPRHEPKTPGNSQTQSREIGNIRENADTAREYGYPNIGRKLDEIADDKEANKQPLPKQPGNR